MDLISALGHVRLPVELVKQQSGVTLSLAPLVLHFLSRYAPDGTPDVLFWRYATGTATARALLQKDENSGTVFTPKFL